MTEKKTAAARFKAELRFHMKLQELIEVAQDLSCLPWPEWANEEYPECLPSFDEFLNQLIDWREPTFIPVDEE